MTRLLIVNADDYGLTAGISEGILRAHREGIVTSTSVLVLGPAYPKVSHLLADHPDLGVGVHLAAVGEDPPLLSRSEVPTLFDRHGRLPHTWATFIARAAAGRVDPADLEREFTAQLELARELGHPLTHLDAHQHLQLWPLVGRVVLRLARRFAIPAVRVPRLRRLSVTGAGVSVLGVLAARRCRRAGIAFPCDAVGIEVAGCLDPSLLDTALASAARRRSQAVEIAVHPGETEDPDRARYDWGYCWGQELDTLTSARARALVAQRGFVLGTYRDLAAALERR